MIENSYGGPSSDLIIKLGQKLGYYGGKSDWLSYIRSRKLKYDAALVLWKRDDDNDEIEVHSAISFGTIALTDAHREEYAENRPGMLPGVGMDAWNHLESKGEAREMVIPKAGFLYKVYQNPVSRSYNDTSKVDADPQQDYFTGEGIGNFVVVSTSNLFNS